MHGSKGEGKDSQRFRGFPNETVVGSSGKRCQKFVDWSARGSPFKHLVRIESCSWMHPHCTLVDPEVRPAN